MTDPEPMLAQSPDAGVPQAETADQAPPAPRPPTRILLIRHGINDYVKKGLLAGRTPDVHLNEDGQAQALAVAGRLAGDDAGQRKISAVYSSPLERCRETAEPLTAQLGLELRLLDDVKETDCGEWTGQALEELRKAESWQQVQVNPSGFRFPNGESMLEIQARMVAALERLQREHTGETIAVFSHSDPIKLAIAFYVGMPLDLFQRLDVSPASVSELDFSPLRVRLVRLNDCAHVPPAKEEPQAVENVGAGSAEPPPVGAVEGQVIRGAHGVGPEPEALQLADEGILKATGG